MFSSHFVMKFGKERGMRNLVCYTSTQTAETEAAPDEAEKGGDEA